MRPDRVDAVDDVEAREKLRQRSAEAPEIGQRAPFQLGNRPERGGGGPKGAPTVSPAPSITVIGYLRPEVTYVESPPTANGKPANELQ